MIQPVKFRRTPRPDDSHFAGGLLGVSLTLLVGGGLAQLAGQSTVADVTGHTQDLGHWSQVAS